MAPTIFPHIPSSSDLHHFTRSISSQLHVRAATTDFAKTPLTSIFAVIIRAGTSPSVSSRSIQSSSTSNTVLVSHAHALSKRQLSILAIPTTYQGLNAGPAPGTVAGVTIGAIAGFLLLLYAILTAFRLVGNNSGGTVIEEEIIHRRSRSPPRPRRRSRSVSASQMSEVRSPPRRTRPAEVIVEERVQRDPSIVVEEDDIVEVIEEHSPERRPARRETKRNSGFRTVDPTEFGGGRAPTRKVGRR